MGRGVAASRVLERGYAFARALCVVLGMASLGACNGFSLFAEEKDAPEVAADQLYNQGVFLLNEKKDYKEAAKKFEEVDRQHPYSDWARKSLIMSAFAYYEARQYDDCIATAKRYISLHPGTPEAPYAQYLIGS